MPAGMPLSANVTTPVNPFCAAIVTVKLVLFPAVMVCELGDAASVKFAGSAMTTTLTVVLLLSDPLLPAIVNV